jgi:hypothetical protein
MNFMQVARRSWCLLLWFLWLALPAHQALAQDSTTVHDGVVSKAKRPRPIQIIFDEEGHMIHFPAPVIRESDRVIFAVRISKASFAREVKTIYGKLDSVYAFFKKTKENQVILWSLFPDSDEVKAFLKDLDDFHGLEQNLDTLPDNKRLSPATYDTAKAAALWITKNKMPHLPLAAYMKKLLYGGFSARLYMGDNNLIGEYYLRPQWILKHAAKHQEDCYWWISDTLSIAKLIAGGCRDCGGQIRFAMTYYDPLKTTMVDWYKDKFSALAKDVPDPLNALNKLDSESVRFARDFQKKKSTNPENFIRFFVDNLVKPMINKAPAAPENTEFRQIVATATDTLPAAERETLLSIADSLQWYKDEAYRIFNDSLNRYRSFQQGSNYNADSEVVVMSNLLHFLAEGTGEDESVLVNNGTPFGLYAALFNHLRNDRLGKISDKVAVRLYTYAIDHSVNFTVEVPAITIHDSVFLTRNSDPALQARATLVKDIRLLQHWLIEWLWYNKGWLVINPIPIHPDAWVQAQKDSLEKENTLLTELNQQKAFLDSSRVHVRPGLWHLDDYKETQAQIDKTNGQIKALTKQIAEIKKGWSGDSAARATFTDAKQVYVGLLPVSCPTCLLSSRDKDIARQFSYAQAKQAVVAVYGSEEEKGQVTEIPENVHASVLVHNIPYGAKVSVQQTLSSFDDTEEFTKLVQTLLKGLDSTGLLGTALGANLNNLSNFLGSTVKSASTNAGMETAAAKVGGPLTKVQDILPQKDAEYVANSEERASFPLDTSKIVAAPLKSSTDSTHGFQSSIYACIDSAAPYQLNIAIQVDSAKGKGDLKVGKLRRFQLAAGIAIVNHASNQNSIDTAGNGFRLATADNSSQIILGVKIYPWKSYQRDGEIIPRYPLRRFSFMAAMSIPKVFSNFYLGGAYDIVPGLTFGIGENIAKQTYYQIQNAQIVNSATRYGNSGAYFSITVNPVILAQFVKLFFN